MTLGNGLHEGTSKVTGVAQKRRQDGPGSASPAAEASSDVAASPEGLTKDEAATRLQHYGPNELPEKKLNPLVKFLSYFMAPSGWRWAAVVWAYVLAWFVINDRIKLGAYRLFLPNEPTKFARGLAYAR